MNERYMTMDHTIAESFAMGLRFVRNETKWCVVFELDTKMLATMGRYSEGDNVKPYRSSSAIHLDDNTLSRMIHALGTDEDDDFRDLMLKAYYFCTGREWAQVINETTFPVQRYVIEMFPYLSSDDSYKCAAAGAILTSEHEILWKSIPNAKFTDAVTCAYVYHKDFIERQSPCGISDDSPYFLLTPKMNSFEVTEVGIAEK